ncbi:hypothetical protein KACHI17_04960 [Sediminibacterium sp. KACHI17]|uniref:Uncharacterized protein n=1 Tax=Sediminibacterium sp. KACHI17 TaxID=1751071 RepID=A0AAT9GG24_9BACT
MAKNYNRSRQYNNNNSRNDRDYVKKSGCTKGFAQGEQNRPYVRGWRASKRDGITTYMCSPYKSKTSETKQHKSNSGRIWENWACKVQPQNGQSFFVSCLYEPASGKVIIPELSMVLNPKGGRGGYCGRNYYKD